MAKFSASFSFAGWDWKLWLKGNKEAAKLVVSALFGLWIPATPELKLVAGTVLKLVLDLIDFYSSKVELPA